MLRLSRTGAISSAVAVLLALQGPGGHAQDSDFPPLAERSGLVLSNHEAVVAVDLMGGSIVHFQFRPDGLNPLVWNDGSLADAPRPRGHFLCLDRWGQPSEAESANGMPFHGEAANADWQVTKRPPHSSSGFMQAKMAARLPLAGLSVERTITLSRRGASFRVSEAVTNLNPLGRIYNMVQHPTIGPPFLDESVLVDTNARQGFMQSSPLPDPENPAVVWPAALKADGTKVDMRRLLDDPAPNVVSYVFEDQLGWVTAANPAKGLLIGYAFHTDEYPWLNLWRHVDEGGPLARGLEFGTTGLHQPFPALVRKGNIFGKPLFAHIDAAETQTRSYMAFLLAIPKDFAGTASVKSHDGSIFLTELGPSGREFKVSAEFW